MADKLERATIFAYQVGFGDCILVRFTYKGGALRHILFDFGTTGLPEAAASDQMTRIAEDITKKVKEGGDDARLDVVVATHRHADHISGFATKTDETGSGDIIRRLEPRLVVQPWTEGPDAPIDWLGPEEKKEAKKAFAGRKQSLAAMHATAKLALDYAKSETGADPRGVIGQLRFIGEDNLANASAVRNLMNMGDRHAYVYHGADLDTAAELPGVEIHVLGPPTLRQTETIRKQRSRDPDEFWQLAPQRVAAAFPEVEPKVAGKRKTKKKDPLFPDAPTLPGGRLPNEMRWLARRLDESNQDLLLGMVRALDKQMNNTSVILVLKAGTKTMLFPGDAQIENWAYALQSPLAKHLADVAMYKVGHHGSLNATPKSLWNLLPRRGPAKTKGRLVSVLSTKHGKHGSVANNSEVPKGSLVRELQSSSELHSTEDLPPEKLYEVVELDLTK